jgi:hypothetical protein
VTPARHLARLIDEAEVRRERAGHDPGPLMVGVTVRACDRGKCRSMRTQAKVDTGAGRTHIPKHVVAKLRPRKTGTTEARGITGTAKTSVYGGVELDLSGRRVVLPRVLEYPRPDVNYVLLGRGAMAGMKLSYDGSTGHFALEPKSPVKPKKSTPKRAKAKRAGRR